jgi:hypothetical protein
LRRHDSDLVCNNWTGPSAIGNRRYHALQLKMLATNGLILQGWWGCGIVLLPSWKVDETSIHCFRSGFLLSPAASRPLKDIVQEGKHSN